MRNEALRGVIAVFFQFGYETAQKTTFFCRKLWMGQSLFGQSEIAKRDVAKFLCLSRVCKSEASN